MQQSYRSLLCAIMACVTTYLFAKSAPLGPPWLTGTLFFGTIVLGVIGFVIGLRDARKSGNTLQSWLAPGLNALLLVLFIAFFSMIYFALQKMN